MTSTFSRLLAAALLPLALAACSDDQAPATGSAGPKVSGSVVKGITKNAVVTITAPDGTLLATRLSDDFGGFSASLPAGYEGAVRIVVTASLPPDKPTQMRCDAASGCVDIDGNTAPYGAWFTVPADFELRSVAAIQGGGIHLVNVTPLSTLAARWADLFPQGLTADGANDANARVAALFGMALTDLEEPSGDITSKQWTNVATPKQVQLALLYATFAELAAQSGGYYSEQAIVDLIAAYFAGQGGSLLQSSGGPGVSIDYLLGTSATLAGTVDMPAATYTTVQDAITALRSPLVPGVLSSVTPVPYTDLIAKLGPLGAQVEQLLALTGLNDPKQFILNESPYFAWLLTTDNLNLAPLGLETVMYGLLGSLQLDLAPAGTTTVVLFDDPGVYTVTLDIPSKKITYVGTRYGQAVNMTVDVSGFFSGAQAGYFAWGINGVVVNPTASGAIQGTLTIDTTGTDFQPLLTAFAAMQASDPSALAQLQSAIDGLAYSLKASVTLAGNAQLINNADHLLEVAGNVSLTAAVDLAAQTGQTLASLSVDSADLVLPHGNHLYAVSGKPVLTITIGDNATLQLDGAATVLGLPEAIAHAEGQLDNARLYFDYARTTILNAVDTLNFNIPTLVNSLLAFDFSQLALHGSGSITIPALGHEYRATVENLTATVYQPFSTDVAATATLVPSQQKVHFTLGAAAEPWDLRVMTTPTPRLVLVGPNGQFAEATQEDVYAFLNDLPLGNLLGAVVPTP